MSAPLIRSCESCNCSARRALKDPPPPYTHTRAPKDSPRRRRVLSELTHLRVRRRRAKEESDEGRERAGTGSAGRDPRGRVAALPSSLPYSVGSRMSSVSPLAGVAINLLPRWEDSNRPLSPETRPSRSCCLRQQRT